MRTIAHISDLHFGRTKTSLEKALKVIIEERSPDLIIVSGDITQRATALQFHAARKFLSSLSCPIFMVPGNHDVPLYSVWRRFFRPYTLYRRYISEDLEPQYEDEEMVVVGVNTVRIFKIMEGRVNIKQMARVKAVFAAALPNKIKILVSHHPFNMPLGHRKSPLARAHLFWKSQINTEIDLILSGHLHDTLGLYSDRAYKIATPISTRCRGEANSFNIITLASNRIAIDRYEYVQGEQIFMRKKIERFVRQGKTWIRDFDKASVMNL
jgi:3',5'-cyclic AMP phosphodiesterase CpdA